MKRLFFFLFALLVASLAHAREQVILLGTYTGGESRGIYRVRLDDATGTLSHVALEAEASNPAFLALHPNGKYVYALHETDTPDGKGGAVTAFAVDSVTGKLTKLNTETTGGAALAYVGVDPSGRMLVAISYRGGYVASFPLAADGRIEPRKSLIEHQGPLGPNHARQERPHAHSVTFSADGRFGFVADLGLDGVRAYRLDPVHGTLAPHDPAFVAVTPGAGPRHSKFSADGKNFYLISELDSSVTAFRYDAAHGVLTPFQHLSNLPDNYASVKSGSEIRIHPNDRFIYTADRGNQSLTVFARDPASGELTRIETVPSGGKTPRNFALSPDGQWLVSAHQDSNDLTVFSVNPATGRLTRATNLSDAPRAVCVLFLND